VFAMLRGLLFKPRETMEHVVRNPNRELTSSFNFLLIVLYLVNAVLFVSTYPPVQDLLGEYGRWVVALLVPPIIYGFQRFVYVVSARLGLAMFAASKLPTDPTEQRYKRSLVAMSFPFATVPGVLIANVLSVFNSPTLSLVGVYFTIAFTFLLMMYALRTIYDVPTAAALWGPVLVQLIFYVALGMIYFMVLLTIWSGKMI